MKQRSSPRHRLSCVGLVALLIGCGAGSGPVVVIEFWGMGREGEVVQHLVPEFERQNPAIRVRVQQLPWSAAHEKLLTAYAGGSLPDVFQLGSTWVAEFVAIGAIESLDDRIARSALVVAQDYFPGILAANVVDGLIYGVPWYVDTRVIFYRADILARAGYAEPPRTWDTWVEAMTRIKAHAGSDAYAILLPTDEWETPVILALQLDAQLLRDGGRYGNFRSAAFRKALGFYLDIFRRGLAPAVGTAQVANLYQEFARGYFAMYISGPWNIGEFARRLPSAVQHAWATAPMPGPDQDRVGVSLAGGASLAIVRSSTRTDAAWKLIEYLSDPAQQAAFYHLTGDLPARRSAWQDDALADNSYAAAFWTQLQAVTSTPQIPEWERIASKIAHYAGETIRGIMTVDEAVTGLDRETDDLLEKRRWMMQRGHR